jgi:hypothetical protein
MKHLEKGRSQRLAGKRKSNKPSKSRPSSLRQHEVARRKRTRLANLRKNARILQKREEAAIKAAEQPAVAAPAPEAQA